MPGPIIVNLAMGPTQAPRSIILEEIKGYELLDSGDERKLERIAGRLVDRPCAQAIWAKRLDKKKWEMAQSICIRSKEGGGHWDHRQELESDLSFGHDHGLGPLKMRLKFTSFGHCGLFFEQAPLWKKLAQAVKSLGSPGEIKVLNLFGYTGAASLAMAQAGAEVFHVDSAKGVHGWGRESESLSGPLKGKIHWTHQDVRDFLLHSKKRGFKYQGIFLDPPSWGHGTKKEVFDYGQEIQKLIQGCLDVLDKRKNFLLLTSHTPGVQADALKNLFPPDFFAHSTHGELGIRHQQDERILPAGIYYWGDNLSMSSGKGASTSTQV